MKIYIRITDDEDEQVFACEKPTIDMAIDELARVERNMAKGYFPMGDGAYIK